MHLPSFSPTHAVAAAALLGVAFSVPLEGQIAFTGLEGVRTPNGISADGSVIVGSDIFSGSPPVRWTAATGAVPLGSISGDATGISADGSIIVGTGLLSQNQFKPYRWTQDGGATVLTTLPGSIDSRIYGVSADGTIATGFTALSDQYTQATKWIGVDPQPLAFIPGGGTNSMGEAVSADGSTIVGYAATATGQIHAVRWTDTAGLFDLGALGGFNSLATGVSEDGSFIVGYVVPTSTSPEVKGFIWNGTEGKTDLSLRGMSVVPRAVSSDGSLVIGYTQRNGSPLEGFVWTPDSGVRDFGDVLRNTYGLESKLADWSGLYPWEMTADGRFIAGSGFHDGTLEGWLLDRGLNPPPLGESGPFSPVPEPSIYGIASALLLGLLSWKRRKKAAPEGCAKRERAPAPEAR